MFHHHRSLDKNTKLQSLSNLFQLDQHLRFLFRFQDYTYHQLDKRVDKTNHRAEHHLLVEKATNTEKQHYPLEANNMIQKETE